MSYFSAPAAAEVYMTETEALVKVVPSALSFEKVHGILNASQKEQVKQQLQISSADTTFTYFVGKDAGNKMVGYAVIANEIGKYQPITFAVGIAPDFKVSMVEIIAYRESHGSEVRRLSFREQFKGKFDSGLGLDSGIRNIAGATLSCRSIIRGARRALAYIQTLRSTAADTGGEAPIPAATDDPAKNKNGVLRRNQVIMGTSLEIQAWQRPPGNALELAVDEAFALVRQIERAVSRYDDDSELSRWHSTPNQSVVQLSEDLIGVAAAAEKMRDKTDGHFDPAVALLVDFWRKQVQKDELPSALAIAALTSKVESSNWRVLSNERTIVSKTPLSFDAIAKGYALDAIRTILDQQASHYLINFGGQILAVDLRNNSIGTNVVLDHPKLINSADHSIILTNESISVSSDSEHNQQIRGGKVSHLISPISGLPAQQGRYVAVVAASAAEADALSTAVAVMDHPAAVKFALRQKHARILIIEPDGTTYGGLGH